MAGSSLVPGVETNEEAEPDSGGLICLAKELGLLLLFYFIYFWGDTTWHAGS